MRLPVFFLSLLLLCGPAQAQARVQTPHVERIEIFEYGLYQTLNAQKIKDPSAPGGERGVAATIDLVRRTTVIPAEYEMEFGIRFEVIGGPVDAIVPITVVLRFPPPGLKEPGKKPMLEYRSLTVSRIGDTDNYQSYGFDWGWEIVPGVWTFELWYSGRKMAEQKFTIQ